MSDATNISDPADMRARIRAAARDLYVRRGFDGFSFGDIAEATGTTRANIHYHYGSKQRLMAELIEDFVRDAVGRITTHWTAPGTGFVSRWQAQLDDLRRFYQRFNPTGRERSVWSPITRLRLDLDVLGAPGIAALDRVNAAYEASLRQAVGEAVEAGELRPGTPVEDVARLLRMAFMSCGPLTQDRGSFDEVEALFGAMARTIAAAWGTAALARALSRVGGKAT
jgi:AcrR family transcriptional regulator